MTDATRPAEDDQDIFGFEPVAATRYDGDHKCQYECSETAEWAVEWRAPGYTGCKVSLLCSSCSTTNRVHVKPNNLHLCDLSQKALECLPGDVEDDLERVITDGGVVAADCPSCYTDDDSETDCPHLLAGDACPVCGKTLEKPRGAKVQCLHCEYVVNGQRMGQVLDDFDLTYRQASRLLQLFGFDKPATPGSAENNLRILCVDNGIERAELNDLLADLRHVGRYAGEGGSA